MRERREGRRARRSEDGGALLLLAIPAKSAFGRAKEAIYDEGLEKDNRLMEWDELMRRKER